MKDLECEMRAQALIALAEKRFGHSLMIFKELISTFENPADYGWRAFVQLLLYNLPESLLDYEIEIQHSPLSLGGNRALAMLRSSSPIARHRNGQKALEHAQIWEHYEKSPSWKTRTIIASCFAELSKFEMAVKEIENSIGAAPPEQTERLTAKIHQYKQEKPDRLKPENVKLLFDMQHGQCYRCGLFAFLIPQTDLGWQCRMCLKCALLRYRENL